MSWRSAVAAALVLAAAAAMVTAAKPGPKNRRYPDYIVDPRVNCTSEGVFPHPRNCSWYYRCVDYMNMGFYRTYYFECEPGTQFADELDQCVFPSNNRPPCRSDNGHGTSVIYLSCTFKECRQYIPCDGSRSLCKGCYNDNVFPPPTYNFCRHPGQVFDKRKGSCVPQPPENELCYDQMLLPLMEEQPATDGSVSAFPYPISWPSTTTVRPSIAMIDMSVFGITCSEEKRNHFEKELLWDQCRAYCFSMGHLHGLVELCHAYYHCKRSPFGGGWELELKTCPENTVLVDEKKGLCGPFPPGVDVC
ncbi:uncharacterized protein LOC123512111 [Portunus trituberculatus]|uniref:uncharacterized protein LOC123512111 n=1 Tax=Portunus trituberculatus TaxID=210409 RepID=UPI001E1CEE2C|nr:uncharacterized protein LOC123512111 [Portunus trituberculatus]